MTFGLELPCQTLIEGRYSASIRISRSHYGDFLHTISYKRCKIRKKNVISQLIRKLQRKMKNTFFQKYRNAIIALACIFAFALITLVYFSPILGGKMLKQSDNEMFRGATKELLDYQKTTGDVALWTNSMFGGMPAWTLSTPHTGDLTDPIRKSLSLGFPYPIGAVFISMLGFFILLLVLDSGFWISFIGAIAYGFTSYLFIVIGAGHNTKAMAMAFMAPVLAGILLTFKGKYLWGSLLAAFATAFEIRVGHIQITYYLLLVIIIFFIAELISDLKNKKMGHFLKATGCLAVAAILGSLTCTTSLYANYEFGKETTRGKAVLTSDDPNQSNGLDRDYITQWSYGKGETWSLLIPNAKGGASAYIGAQNPALEKADPRFRQNIAQSNAYWGDQPGTSGPVYVGAIVVFLFILGAFVVKGKLKWVLLIATLLSILLSWGKNFMGFTNFFIDHVPGYNKFRAVSMTLVIAELCMPVLAFLGLAEIAKEPESFKKHQKHFFISLGITAGICLLFCIAPKLFFNFLSQNEAQQFASMSSGADGAVYASFATQLENVRVAIFRKDALRSLLFILLAALPIFLYGKNKLKATPTFLILAALVLIDMFPVDKRYLNNDNFVPKRQVEKPFSPAAADQYILDDNSLDFRVLDLTKNVFNDASASYFHKSIGGYSGAKLRRYQDLISKYLSSEISRFGSIFKNATPESITRGLGQQKTLNMLNTKYIIYSAKEPPLLNPSALGNAWIVNDIQWVDTPNEEFDAIATLNPAHSAIINKEFQPQVGNYHPNDSVTGQVSLTEYYPAKLVYHFSAAEDQLVVFSEIWTQKGWKMYVDGQEHPLLRANYLLRAALIPAGDHEIMMEYAPRVWKVGNSIQLASSLTLILGLVAALLFTFLPKKKSQA